MAKPKRPRDPNQLAKLILDIATGEAENVKPVAPREGQRKGGLKGGKARAKKLSRARRVTISRQARPDERLLAPTNLGVEEVETLLAQMRAGGVHAEPQ